MNNLKYLCIILAVILLLCGCDEHVTEPTDGTAAAGASETTAPSETETTEPTDPVVTEPPTEPTVTEPAPTQTEPVPTQTPAVSDDDFIDGLLATKSVKIYRMCEDGDQSIIYSVNGQEHSVSSLKLVWETTVETDLIDFQLLFYDWKPSENTAEPLDTLFDIYICLDNGLVIQATWCDDSGRIDAGIYTLPPALCNFLAQLPE